MERQPSFPATSLTGSSVPSLPSMSCVVPWRSARGACPPCRGWSLGSIRPAKEEKGSLGKICDLNRPKVLGCRWTLAVTLMVMFTSQVVVLGGDLRKILPVVKGGGRSQTGHAAITSLLMWSTIGSLSYGFGSQRDNLPHNSLLRRALLFIKWTCR